MLERFKLMLKLWEKEGKPKKAVMHLALTMHGMERWNEQKKAPIQETYRKSFSILKEIIELQIKNNIPILSVYVLPEQLKKENDYPLFLDELIAFLNSIKRLSLVHDNKVKISALGKWYDIPGRAVDVIKEVLEETKDYDKFFVNLCVNYDGREEIADACRIIGRQIKAGKLDVDAINKNSIKENLYSSYFLPPDLIIKSGKISQTTGFLMWDTPYAIIYFTQKYFPEFTKSDFSKAMEFYSSNKK
ncbi:di-trans,poly-cis-decaprenylcistransferase [Candidatus Woesearchaeota archaeon]|nr:di-trans,poly-cis-decaprenylcistransferase [Candidatus Woesearchaeota archaeon]